MKSIRVKNLMKGIHAEKIKNTNTRVQRYTQWKINTQKCQIGFSECFHHCIALRQQQQQKTHEEILRFKIRRYPDADNQLYYTLD